MAPSGANSCTSCGKEASLRCSKCSEGKDRDGNDSPTHYCSTACQKTDFKNHKTQCRVANARKQLYRGAHLVQDIFFAWREANFDLEITEVKLKDGRAHFYEPESSAALRMQWPILPFPNHLVDPPEVKKGLLSFLSCVDAIACFQQLVVKVVEAAGTKYCETRLIIKPGKQAVDRARESCEGAHDHFIISVKLKGDETYAVDLSGSQHAQYRAVLPMATYLREYCTGLPLHYELGHCDGLLQGYLNDSNGRVTGDNGKFQDTRSVIVGNRLAWIIRHTVMAWGTGPVNDCGKGIRPSGEAVSEMIVAKAARFEVERAELMGTLTKNIKDFMAWWSSPSGPRFTETRTTDKSGAVHARRDMVDSQNFSAEVREMLATFPLE